MGLAHASGRPASPWARCRARQVAALIVQQGVRHHVVLVVLAMRVLGPPAAPSCVPCCEGGWRSMQWLTQLAHAGQPRTALCIARTCVASPCTARVSPLGTPLRGSSAASPRSGRRGAAPGRPSRTFRVALGACALPAGKPECVTRIHKPAQAEQHRSNVV